MLTKNNFEKEKNKWIVGGIHLRTELIWLKIYTVLAIVHIINNEQVERKTNAIIYNLSTEDDF
jgi:hypothetical protein